MMRERTRRAEAEHLDAEILDAVGRGWQEPLAELEFDRLAREVFAHQFRFNPVYRQFCLMRRVSAAPDVGSWRDIPPVPTGAFKIGRWTTFPPEVEAAVFRTSGTTVGAPGIHGFECLGLMNAAIVASARRYLVPDRERIRCLFLSPPPAAARDSSLVHMFAVFREAFGAPGSGFFLSHRADGGFRPDRLANALDAAVRDRESVLVAGAALAFHIVLPALAGRWSLPSGSRAMVTGGAKGVRRMADPIRIAEAIARDLGIPASHQVAEYGMTELSSQYYDAGLRTSLTGGEEGPGFRVPPWARVRIVDPLTGREVDSGAKNDSGAEGAVIHYDLANRASAIALQTSDLGFWRGEDGFELHGREPGAEARGCSLAADLWLERTI
ncbi:MAG TPA: hypothetical protein VM737_02040 [Gemmatimonadota bacterium]|nr:hypothetical protein [Gemmatimonadota bacterium]